MFILCTVPVFADTPPDGSKVQFVDKGHGERGERDEAREILGRSDRFSRPVSGQRGRSHFS